MFVTTYDRSVGEVMNLRTLYSTIDPLSCATYDRV